jgi:hypothetical protein
MYLHHEGHEDHEEGKLKIRGFGLASCLPQKTFITFMRFMVNKPDGMLL